MDVATIFLLIGLIYISQNRRSNYMKKNRAIRLNILFVICFVYSLPVLSMAKTHDTYICDNIDVPFGSSKSLNNDDNKKQSKPCETYGHEGVKQKTQAVAEVSSVKPDHVNACHDTNHVSMMPDMAPNITMQDHVIGLEELEGSSTLMVTANVSLTWGKQEVSSQSRRSLTIVNTWVSDTSLCIFRVYSTNPSNFQVFGFEKTLLQPRGMLSIHVIFMPTVADIVQSLLVIHTSAGPISICMEGVGVKPQFHEILKEKKNDGNNDDATSVDMDRELQHVPLCPLDDEPHFRPSIALRVSNHNSLWNLSDPLMHPVASWTVNTVNTVIPSRLSILGASNVFTFPDTLVGQKTKHWIQVRNPSGMPISIQLFVNSIAQKRNVSNVNISVIPCNKTHPIISDEMPVCTTHHDPKEVGTSPVVKEWVQSKHKSIVFGIEGDDHDMAKIVLPPNSTGAIGPIVFHPYEEEYNVLWQSNVILVNNLTGIEWMRIEGQGTAIVASSSELGLMFFDGNELVDTFEVEVDSSSLPSFSKKTLKEKIETFLDEEGAYGVCHDRRTSKGFIAKNLGNSSVQVASLMLTGSHGFRIDSFHGFSLAPGESAKLLVSYQPDFDRSFDAHGDLQLVTSKGDVLSVTLKARIPDDMIWFCEMAHLLSTVKRIFLQVCLVALFLVLFVFGKMLKQEDSVVSNASVNEWTLSSINGLSKFSQNDRSRPKMVHKRPSIYVSIDLDYTQGQGKKQDCINFLSFTKGALEVVRSAIAYIYLAIIKHLTAIKVWTTRAILMGAVISKSSSKQDMGVDGTIMPDIKKEIHTMSHPNPDHSHYSKSTSLMSNHPQSNSSSRLKISHSRKGKSSMFPLNTSDKLLEPVQSSSSNSSSPRKSLEKEKESYKIGKRTKKRKNIGIGVNPLDHSNVENNSSDSSCHSPRSTPSSPLVRQSISSIGTGRPISPLVKSSIFTPTTAAATLAARHEVKNTLDDLQMTNESKESGFPFKYADSDISKHFDNGGDKDHSGLNLSTASSESTLTSNKHTSDLEESLIKPKLVTPIDEPLKTMKSSDPRQSLIQPLSSIVNDQSLKTTKSSDVEQSLNEPRSSALNDQSLKTTKSSYVEQSLSEPRSSALNDDSVKPTKSSSDVRAISRIKRDPTLVTVSSTNAIPTSAIAPDARAPGTKPRITNADIISTRSTSHDTILTIDKPCSGALEEVNKNHNNDAQALSSFASSPSTLIRDHDYNTSLYDIWGDHFNVELINKGRKPDTGEADPIHYYSKDIPLFSDSFSIFSSPQYPFHVNKAS